MLAASFLKSFKFGRFFICRNVKLPYIMRPYGHAKHKCIDNFFASFWANQLKFNVHRCPFFESVQSGYCPVLCADFSTLLMCSFFNNDCRYTRMTGPFVDHTTVYVFFFLRCDSKYLWTHN